MKDRKQIAIVVGVVGILIALVSVLADTFDLGSDPDFGTLQIIGTVVGIIVLAAGVVYYYYGDRLIGGGSQK